ncbi:MAG TPA: glycine zipper domain-containing protein [Candidatus Competibacter sp.]|jgi:uncharacterized protein (DUF1501 family)|nr:glycine zipper 2TM domain-containing protein [Candidatus Competibacter sp.]HRF61407.1 glycine zipper domain-containing protein [Candidatus Competibacter sp.]HRX59608.1 glycine zipper domain-containing protein [Candidatus Competibacter sp.]HUM90555.1 glycine zipper domain-containing protein [Candidatus Competibacter sp.]
MFIQQIGKTPLAVLLASTILSGCATNPDGTMNDRQQTVAEGAVVGAVLGGLLGGAVSHKGSGALVGAAAGGIIGASIGSSVADRKAQYAREEDFLVAEIQRNQEFIAEADDQNRQLYQEIAQLDRESQRLAREYRAGKVTRDALASQKATLEKQLAKAKQINSLTEKQLADANEVYRESRQQRGPEDQYTQKLESNVVKLKETRQQSQENVARLQKVYDSMSI